MSKKRFVQSVIIRSLPELKKTSEAISYAEKLWDKLSQHGYGADKTNEPRENIDYYQALNEKQAHWFKRFWIVFNYKHGRDGAAKSWGELGELNDADYKTICAAAEKEAQRQLDGRTRKMAQGWLTEKRFNDYEPVKRAKNEVKNHLITGLNNQLNGVKKLYEASKDEALLDQITELEKAIKNARC